MNAKILIVDDSKTDILVIQNILSDYTLLYAYDGVEAIETIKNNRDIDIVILDINMPRMNGFEVLETLQKDYHNRSISTLILTNYDELESEIKGLDLGAVDYIRKPLNIQSLRKRIEIHVNLRNALKSIEEHNRKLEDTVLERTRELIITRDTTIHALIGLLEIRNIESSNHVKRTQLMMKHLCEYLRSQKKYTECLTDERILELFKTAPLHDIGKVSIPDKILLKPGKLDDEEFEIMKKHTTFGVEALTHELTHKNMASFIRTAIEIVGTHHEKFDGTGYPKGLKGCEIPLSGRIMAIVDVYDALTSKRVYKAAISHEDALEIIKNERGKHFDPDIVDVFIEIGTDIQEIAQQYAQAKPPMEVLP